MADQNLKIRISAIDKTKAVFDNIAKRLNKVRKSLMNFKTALLAAGGAAGMIYLVKSSMDGIDKVSKLSRTLGIAVEDLRRLELAADLSGLSLETVARAVRNLNRGMVDFMDGTGEAADAFEKLGITTEDINRVMGDQFKVLELIADRLLEVENSAIRSSIAQDLFGGRASEMLLVLEDGAEGMRRISDEALRFGLILSEKAARGVEDANDSFTRLFALFKGLRDQVVSQLAPAIQTGVDAIRKKIQEIVDTEGGVREFARKMAHTLLDAVQAFGETMLMIFDKLRFVINALIAVANKFNQMFLEEGKISASEFAAMIEETNTHTRAMSDIMDQLDPRVKNVVSRFDELTSSTELNKDEILQFIMQLHRLRNGFDESGGGAEVQRAAIDGLIRRLSDLVLVMDNVVPEMEYFGEINSDLSETFDGLRASVDATAQSLKPSLDLFKVHSTESERLSDSINELTKENERLQNAFGNTVERGRGLIKFYDNTAEATAKSQIQMAKMTDGLDVAKTTGGEALKTLAEDSRDLNKNLEDVAVRGIRSLEDAMVSAITGTMKLKDAFKSMAASIISDIMRMYIRMQISAPIAQAMSSFFQTPTYAFGSGAHPGEKAMGGSVSAGKPFLVGEKGAELFIPGGSGTIIPSNQLGGGGTVVNQTINVSTGVSQTVRAEIMNLMPQIAEGTKAAVLDARRRGGTFAGAFGG